MSGESMGPVGHPLGKNWDKILKVAGHRLLGASREEAAKSVGVSPMSIKRWEKSAWWGFAQQRAREQWFQEAEGEARKGLKRALAGDGRLALSFLERIDPALAPAPAVTELRAVLARVEIEKLPAHALQRVADGESLVSVLLALTSEERMRALPPPTLTATVVHDEKHDEHAETHE